MENKIKKFTTYTDYEVGTDRVLPTRTVNIDLDGKTLVSMATYSGHEVTVSIHNLTYQDMVRLQIEIGKVLLEMHDAGWVTPYHG